VQRRVALACLLQAFRPFADSLVTIIIIIIIFIIIITVSFSFFMFAFTGFIRYFQAD
jgi:hypothetical protein